MFRRDDSFEQTTQVPLRGEASRHKEKGGVRGRTPLAGARSRKDRQSGISLRLAYRAAKIELQHAKEAKSICSNLPCSNQFKGRQRMRWSIQATTKHAVTSAVTIRHRISQNSLLTIPTRPRSTYLFASKRHASAAT